MWLSTLKRLDSNCILMLIRKKKRKNDNSTRISHFDTQFEGAILVAVNFTSHSMIVFWGLKYGYKDHVNRTGTLYGCTSNCANFKTRNIKTGKPLGQCHAFATFLRRLSRATKPATFDACHAFATLLPRFYHAFAALLPRFCHAFSRQHSRQHSQKQPTTLDPCHAFCHAFKADSRALILFPEIHRI